MKTVLTTTLILFTILSSCKKEEQENIPTNDYRTSFTGQYEFTVIHKGWSTISPSAPADTSNYTGSIELFQTAHASENVYGNFNHSQSPEKRITIRFKDDLIVIPTVSSSGLLENINSGSSVQHEFNGSISGNNISFFTSIEGMNGGSEYTVTGVKIP